jgi:hypothetical protein
MGGVFWRDGSWEVAKPTTITQFKMEDVCNLYNVIKNVLPKKSNQYKKKKVFLSFQAPNGIDTIV